MICVCVCCCHISASCCVCIARVWRLGLCLGGCCLWRTGCQWCPLVGGSRPQVSGCVDGQPVGAERAMHSRVRYLLSSCCQLYPPAFTGSGLESSSSSSRTALCMPKRAAADVWLSNSPSTLLHALITRLVVALLLDQTSAAAATGFASFSSFLPLCLLSSFSSLLFLFLPLSLPVVSPRPLAPFFCVI